jgi:hypothetical protein
MARLRSILWTSFGHPGGCAVNSSHLQRGYGVAADTKRLGGDLIELPNAYVEAPCPASRDNQSLHHQAERSGKHEGDSELDHVLCMTSFLNPLMNLLVLPRWM